jgi:hypothetical protein
LPHRRPGAGAGRDAGAFDPSIAALDLVGPLRDAADSLDGVLINETYQVAQFWDFDWQDQGTNYHYDGDNGQSTDVTFAILERGGFRTTHKTVPRRLGRGDPHPRLVPVHELGVRDQEQLDGGRADIPRHVRGGSRSSATTPTARTRRWRPPRTASNAPLRAARARAISTR